MVATSQEKVRECEFLQVQGKIREFHFESGEVCIFKRRQGNVKF